ncbi:hypothetical protein SAMN05428959_101207 [Duganella sp. CF517]|uniref:hypothetical protein n=1 Tax=Duganella sp. CF517 TaxID=1881038 RepID=UPI0008CE34C7|nr:hypothetical protein [Duganella sp. CF517]SEN10402.1 hypothetical protein SAMN05428959_101207 [Duganella sp. CF517]
MNKTILKLLSAAALVATVAAPAVAATAHGRDVDVTIEGFTPVSSTGNTFTFSGGRYDEDGIPSNTSYKQLFLIDAHAGKALTGKMSFTMDVEYEFGTDPNPWPHTGNYSAYARASFDVLSPNCGTCGPFDAELLGNAQGANTTIITSPTNGKLSFASNASAASGSYDRLFAYMFYDMALDPAYGSFNITALTVSFEAVDAASPVPELPPFAMMGAGLAALGLCARYKGRKKTAAIAA